MQTRFKHAPMLLTMVLLVLTSISLRAQVDCDANARLSVGTASAAAGNVVQVELRGSSLCEVNGFGMAIGHDPTRVEFLLATPGPFLRNHAGGDLLSVGQRFESQGFVALLVQIDVNPPFSLPPPTGIPDDTVLATLIYRVLPEAEPGEVILLNEDQRFGNPRISHVFTTDTIPRGVRPILSSGSITILESAPRFRRGDANADGERNVTDAVFVLTHLFGGGEEPSCLKSADFNDSGQIDLTDPVYLLNFLFARGPQPAAPFPECGSDPTRDALTCVSFEGCQ